METNEALVQTVNHSFALLTLIGFIVIVMWFLKLVAHRFGFLGKYRHWMEALARVALPLGLLTSLFAVLGSLYYSEFLHIEPCELCWYQRIFIYPMVVLFGLAWYKKVDKHVYDYIMILSGMGLTIALYHHYLQLGYNLLKPCSSAPFAVDCSTPTFIEFGFITYPFMAVVTLSFTFLLAYTAKKFGK